MTKSPAGRRLGKCGDAQQPLPTVVQAGVVLQDPSGRVVVASEQAARLLEVDGPEILTGRPALFEDHLAIHVDGSAFPTHEQPAAMAIETRQAQSDIVLGLRRPNAPTLWFNVRAEPLMNVGSSVPYMAVSRFISLASSVTAGLAKRPRRRPARLARH